ncbi:MAG: hypothetical protein WC393_01720 [Candidatus Nanoarchaeia archaeon]|jgi:hypothetical protein
MCILLNEKYKNLIEPKLYNLIGSCVYGFNVEREKIENKRKEIYDSLKLDLKNEEEKLGEPFMKEYESAIIQTKYKKPLEYFLKSCILYSMKDEKNIDEEISLFGSIRNIFSNDNRQVFFNMIESNYKKINLENFINRLKDYGYCEKIEKHYNELLDFIIELLPEYKEITKKNDSLSDELFSSLEKICTKNLEETVILKVEECEITQEIKNEDVRYSPSGYMNMHSNNVSTRLILSDKNIKKELNFNLPIPISVGEEIKVNVDLSMPLTALIPAIKSNSFEFFLSKYNSIDLNSFNIKKKFNIDFLTTKKSKNNEFSRIKKIILPNNITYIFN